MEVIHLYNNSLQWVLIHILLETNSLSCVVFSTIPGNICDSLFLLLSREETPSSLRLATSSLPTRLPPPLSRVVSLEPRSFPPMPSLKPLSDVSPLLLSRSSFSRTLSWSFLKEQKNTNYVTVNATWVSNTGKQKFYITPQNSGQECSFV